MDINSAKGEFEKYLRKWAVIENRWGNGIDVGCGTARIDNMIVSIDRQPDYKYAHAQFVWDCHDLELFNNGVLDFLFSSHVLEDFEDIETVFLNWWRKLKVGGVMLLLLPDMEGGRYPKIEEKNPDGSSKGNPSHHTNVGKDYIHALLDRLKSRELIDYKIEQEDTVPHNESSSIDFVIRRL